MAEYIYSMVRARKTVGEKLILDDVTMAFLPGAIWFSADDAGTQRATGS